MNIPLYLLTVFKIDLHAYMMNFIAKQVPDIIGISRFSYQIRETHT